MKYKIIRYYHPTLNKLNEVVEEGLTLKQAQAHCNDPSTNIEGMFFDGYIPQQEMKIKLNDLKRRY